MHVCCYRGASIDCKVSLVRKLGRSSRWEVSEQADQEAVLFGPNKHRRQLKLDDFENDGPSSLQMKLAREIQSMFRLMLSLTSSVYAVSA